MKKETIEETAENESEYLADWENKTMYQKGFIEGAKYQAEILINDLLENYNNYLNFEYSNIKLDNQDIEQFKKK